MFATSGTGVPTALSGQPTIRLHSLNFGGRWPDTFPEPGTLDEQSVEVALGQDNRTCSRVIADLTPDQADRFEPSVPAFSVQNWGPDDVDCLERHSLATLTRADRWERQRSFSRHSGVSEQSLLWRLTVETRERGQFLQNVGQKRTSNRPDCRSSQTGRRLTGRISGR